MLTIERVYRTVYATKSQARSDVIRYGEGFHSSRRRHSAPGITVDLVTSLMVINSQHWQSR